jgi:16S rRNA (cytosine(967)-C(5))-methyltransferase
MKIESLVNIAEESLRIIIKNKQIPDKYLNELFRIKKFIGSNERKFIQEIIFISLRNLLLIEYLVEKINAKFNLKLKNIILTLILLELKILESNNINKILNKNNFDYKIIFELIKDNNSLNSFNNMILDDIRKELFSEYQILINEKNYKILYSINEWLINLIKQTSFDHIKLLKNSTNEAPTFIRINNYTSNTYEIEKYLQENQIDYEKSTLTNSSFKINTRVKLDNTKLFLNGAFEIQDEGSQLISYALAPKENSLILDACAGAGGKTLHIADLTKNNSIIYASDIEYGRLKQISKRAQRCNFTNIYPKYIKNQDINELKKLFDYNEFDYVLIDAPCSGLGTIRRDPTRKYKVTPEFIRRISNNQYKILSQYSKFVKIGGILVYATCSLLNEENQKIIEKFLNENNNFEPSNLIEAFNTYNIYIDDLKYDDFQLSIGFDKYSFDCFYMARLKRIK